MGFDVKIIAKVSFTDEGEPYTHYKFVTFEGEKLPIVEPVFEIPKPPEELRPYMNMQGWFWEYILGNNNEYQDVNLVLDSLPDWDEIPDEKKEDEDREDYEQWKKLLEWCVKQECDFLILGWA